jgi:hypothetical protein
MIVLNGKVQNSKTLRIAPRCSGERQAHRWKDMLAPKRRELRAQRYVHRLRSALHGPRVMRHAPSTHSLSTGTRTSPTPAQRKP